MTVPLAGGGEAGVYGLHGLRLRSPVPLAGFSQPPDLHDVDVRWVPSGPVSGGPPPGRLVAAAGTDGAYLYVAAIEGGRWTLRVGGICDFVVDGGLDVIECHPDPAADPQLVAVLLAGLVVAFVLGLAGHCVLHASAVDVDGAGIAIAGPSGAGKSTLAALLCGEGARLITDDVLRLDVGVDVGVGVMCIGGSPQLRLRPGAAWTLDRFAVAPPSGSTVDGRLSVAPAPSPSRDVSLAAIVLPRLSRETDAIDLRPVSGAASVARLAAVCRIAGWRDPDVMRSQFRALTLVAAGVQVVEAVIPWGAARPSAIVAALRALV